MNKQKRILIVVNSDWFFLSHRLPIAIEAKKQGFDVHISSRDNGLAGEIESYGFTFHELPISCSGTNPIEELLAAKHFVTFYKKIKPDLVHHVTLKPVVYGSLAARILNIPTLNALSGMGYVFTSHGGKLLPFIIKNFIKLGWKPGLTHVIFQNPDDRKQVEDLGLLKNIPTTLIKGSGVDLEEFSFSELPLNSHPKRVVLPARLLFDKGIREFKEAAVLLKENWQGKVIFQLAGDTDFGNRTSITEEELKTWEDPGYFEWIGYQKNVVELLKQSYLVVLPSYREGLPKSLIEANASGRPIVTTDTVGCRECVIPNYNGLLAKLQDVDDLSRQIDTILSDEELAIKMSRNARIFAEQEFSITKVVSKHIELYNKLLS
ncbi:MAG: glycosyltransferase family 4 protein [Flavobacteriales bacterium]